MALPQPPAKRAKTAPASTPTTATKATVISGDALEDDFLLDDEDTFADLDQEGTDDIALAALSDEDQVAPDSGDSDDDAIAEVTPAKKKRKLSPSESPSSKNVNVDPSAAKKAKRAKAKEAKRAKIKQAQDEEGENGGGGEASLGMLPTESLLDRFVEKQRNALKGWSELELDEVKVTASMILDTSTVTARKSLMTFIREAIPSLPSTLAKPPKKFGSPRVIVVSGAALRVADLCRDVKPYKTKEIDVAKLFAKHFKLQEHVEYLQKTKVGIAIGTPSRIGKLLVEPDALHLHHLSHLILDVTHLDAKNKALLDQPEARDEVFKEVLGNKEVGERLREGKMKLVFF